MFPPDDAGAPMMKAAMVGSLIACTVPLAVAFILHAAMRHPGPWPAGVAAALSLFLMAGLIAYLLYNSRAERRAAAAAVTITKSEVPRKPRHRLAVAFAIFVPGCVVAGAALWLIGSPVGAGIAWVAAGVLLIGPGVVLFATRAADSPRA